MSKPKLTGWYAPEQKPERVGVYERDMPFNLGKYSFWDGKWYGWSSDIVGAKENRSYAPSSMQSVRWRGLARAPRGGE